MDPRNHNEAIVDPQGPEVQVMGWYHYLEGESGPKNLGVYRVL
jgi:hypothetical protein